MKQPKFVVVSVAHGLLHVQFNPAVKLEDFLRVFEEIRQLANAHKLKNILIDARVFRKKVSAVQRLQVAQAYWINGRWTPSDLRAKADNVLERLSGNPGVQSVALADSLPLTAQQGNYVFDAENHPRDARQGALLATGRTVSPGYFSTLGLTLVRGRLLDDEDNAGATRAVVINQRMAEHLWPHQDPLIRSGARSRTSSILILLSLAVF